MYHLCLTQINFHHEAFYYINHTNLSRGAIHKETSLQPVVLGHASRSVHYLRGSQLAAQQEVQDITSIQSVNTSLTPKTPNMLIISERTVVRVLTTKKGAPYLRLEVTRGDRIRKIPVFLELWQALVSQADYIGQATEGSRIHLEGSHYFILSIYEGQEYRGVHTFKGAERIPGGWNLTPKEFEKLLSTDIIQTLGWMISEADERTAPEYF